VSDTLYRSAQPTAEGLHKLKELGITTVVNLRSFHSDRDEIDPGLGYEHIHMKSWHAEREDAIRFLRIATDPARVPVLVHCQHGADRTGSMIAVYRVIVQGWSKDDAIREMKAATVSTASGATCRNGSRIWISTVCDEKWELNSRNESLPVANS
jgi:protein tyrosine/serine phosphatase